MSRSSEAYQEQQEQENLSGADDFEAWVASMETNKQKLIEDQENDSRKNKV